jgi:hypothetical protein
MFDDVAGIDWIILVKVKIWISTYFGIPSDGIKCGLEKKTFLRLFGDQQNSVSSMLRAPLVNRAARWYILKTKILIWENFRGPWNGKWWYVFFAIWNLVRPFGNSLGFDIFFHVLVYCITKNLANKSNEFNWTHYHSFLRCPWIFQPHD